MSSSHKTGIVARDIGPVGNILQDMEDLRGS